MEIRNQNPQVATVGTITDGLTTDTSPSSRFWPRGLAFDDGRAYAEVMSPVRIAGGDRTQGQFLVRHEEPRVTRLALPGR